MIFLEIHRAMTSQSFVPKSNLHHGEVFKQAACWFKSRGLTNNGSFLCKIVNRIFVKIKRNKKLELNKEKKCMDVCKMNKLLSLFDSKIATELDCGVFTIIETKVIAIILLFIKSSAKNFTINTIIINLNRNCNNSFKVNFDG
ncbi:hypothetical protein BpHYR1_044704 [Brachionus plicatilis]|uniref:Uncharacterized protein n=1 Tax=Brachionus plicatilis TaxID=10195 RepID=A0A3M7SR22_BRAPC|nr:hypothetical protein BpHYR1_044704 [Brachionus plicatilis]